MRQLIARTGFFRQHPLANRRICGNERPAGIHRITLRPGGYTVGAFREGCSYDTLMELFTILTALFGDHPRPFAGIVRNVGETRRQEIRWPNGGRLRGSRREGRTS